MADVRSVVGGAIRSRHGTSLLLYAGKGHEDAATLRLITTDKNVVFIQTLNFSILFGFLLTFEGP